MSDLTDEGRAWAEFCCRTSVRLCSRSHQAGLCLPLSVTPEDSSFRRGNGCEAEPRRAEPQSAIGADASRPQSSGHPLPGAARRDQPGPASRASTPAPPRLPDPTAGPAPHLGPGQRRGRHGPAQEGGGEEQELEALQPGQRHGTPATRKGRRGSQPPKPRLIRRDPRARRRHFRHGALFTEAGGGVGGEGRREAPFRAAGTASSPRAPSGGPAGRCGRSWAASARSGRPGWARTARGRRSGRGARGTASRPAARQ